MFYLIRHQQNRFRHVKRASSKKIKGWGIELFYNLFCQQTLWIKQSLWRVSLVSLESLCWKLFFFLLLLLFCYIRPLLLQYCLLWDAEAVAHKVHMPNYIKKRLQYQCFPVNSVQVLKAPFLQNISASGDAMQNLLL